MIPFWDLAERFQVKRFTREIAPTLRLSAHVGVEIGVEFGESVKLRVFALEGSGAVELQGDVTEVVSVDGVTVTSSSFSRLDKVTADSDLTISLYTTEEVWVEIGEVKGVRGGRRSSVGSDIHGNLFFVHTDELALEPTLEVRPDDVLVDANGVQFRVVDITPAYTTRGVINHYEASVVRVSE